MPFAVRATILLGVACFALPAFAQNVPRDDRALLTVNGQGTVSATPDQVIINAGVVTSAKTAREALGQNSQTMTSVFAALKKSGVPDKAIRTTNLNLSPQYAPAGNGMMSMPFDRPIIGYRVSNTVNVTLDDVGHAGAILDALVAAGANQANGMSYVFKNDQGLLTQAREAAVRTAIEHAKTYAVAAGVILGPIHAISDTNTFSPVYPAMAAMSSNVAQPLTAPIGVGEQILRANVVVSWEIKQ
jgi:uncharacterized protein YggE